MAIRSILALAVMMALQALAGCGVPATSGVAQDEQSAWQKAEFAAREARLRIQMRKQVEAGTLGLAQLYPGGMPVDARHLPPLPRPVAVAIPVHDARSSPAETQMQLALAVSQRRAGACVYKPIMSDADIDACR